MRWIKPAIVRRVIDGDTVVLDIDLGFRAWLTGQHVRLVSIGPGGRMVSFDAPEISGARAVPAGKVARDRLSVLLPVGAEVTIETFKGPDTDKYGRWLAIIWPGAESLDVAGILAAEGLGVLGG